MTMMMMMMMYYGQVALYRMYYKYIWVLWWDYLSVVGFLSFFLHLRTLCSQGESNLNRRSRSKVVGSVQS